MAIKHIDLEDKYLPRTKTRDILVQIKIGDAADTVGSYSVFLGTEFISSNKVANLGNKSNVEDKKTTIVVIVPDVLKETNWTSTTVFIKEGASDPQIFGPYKAEVEEHLDTAIFTLKLSHK